MFQHLPLQRTIKVNGLGSWSNYVLPGKRVRKRTG